MSADDVTDPDRYWPAQYADHSDTPLADALFAVAAELRTANQIAFLTLRNHSTLTQKTLAPIAARIGLET